MGKRMIVASGFALVLVLGACGSSNDDNAKSDATTPPAPPATVEVARSAQGQVLVDANGMTLYRFDKDNRGVSNCAGACAQTWPPLLLQTGTTAPVTGAGVQGPLSVIARPDGGRQVADDGRALYRYAGDIKAGDTNGDGIGGIWHVVNVGAVSAPSSTLAPAGRDY